MTPGRQAWSIGWPALLGLAMAGLMLVFVVYPGTERELQVLFAFVAVGFALVSGVLIGIALAAFDTAARDVQD